MNFLGSVVRNEVCQVWVAMEVSDEKTPRLPIGIEFVSRDRNARIGGWSNAFA